MKNRNFKMDTEWNMIHYPERPQGFGILIIGDERHFVDEKSSFWTQYEGKLALINSLNEAGYTVFYSNLYGRHWGSEKAVKLAHQLYEYVIRNEIINEKIHLIAEGMGALAALKLMEKMEEQLRSIVLLNPVLSLKHQLEQEREQKFFYKKLLKELTESYALENVEKIEQMIQHDDLSQLKTTHIPVKVFQVLAGNRAYKQSKLLKELSIQWKNEKAPIKISYLVPEKKVQLGYYITKFLKSHESL